MGASAMREDPRQTSLGGSRKTCTTYKSRGQRNPSRPRRQLGICRGRPFRKSEAFRRRGRLPNRRQPGRSGGLTGMAEVPFDSRGGLPLARSFWLVVGAGRSARILGPGQSPLRLEEGLPVCPLVLARRRRPQEGNLDFPPQRIDSCGRGLCPSASNRRCYFFRPPPGAVGNTGSPNLFCRPNPRAPHRHGRLRPPGGNSKSHHSSMGQLAPRPTGGDPLRPRSGKNPLPPHTRNDWPGKPARPAEAKYRTGFGGKLTN